MSRSYDVVVIGSGAAGPVVVRRLLDRTDARVLLIEAGGPDINPQIHEPGAMFAHWGGPEDWDYETEPQRGAAGRRLRLPRGRVLGGSTAINGMIYVRGWSGDYDSWAYRGNHGWAYADVLPLFKRSEDFDGGPSAYRGVGGPLHVQSDYDPHPLSTTFVEAAGQIGIPANPDHNGTEIVGAGLAQFAIRDGRRQSSMTAFLGPVAGHERLAVLTGTRARRVVLEGDRCVGVEVERDGVVEVIRAGSEVVVCAGALESPTILMHSGIGDPAHLREHGIDVRVPLPGVGENLHDHTLAPMLFAATRPVPPPAPGHTPHQAQLFWHSRDGLPGPDLQPLAFNVPLYPEGTSGPQSAFTILPGHVRPASRGRLRLRSPDPTAPPAIDPAYLQCDSDLAALVAGVRLCREMSRQGAYTEWGVTELYPGPGVTTESEIRDYVRTTLMTYHHPVGTCRMGLDTQAVVDPELRVRGVTGLRVADASVMPTVPTGNTMAPAIMIGERAADLVTSGLGAATATAAR